jgi:predicted negative regulator of RcsB-dependent stress response
MTSIRTPDDSEAGNHAQTFIDWTRLNANALAIGAVVVLVAGGSYWFYQRSQQLRDSQAEKALMNAKESMASGNVALAQSDLQKLRARWASTPAGISAAMLLAQIDYDTGKYQDGVSLLKQVEGESAAAPVRPTIVSLEGDGYAQMGKLADAAKAYEAAAAAAPYATEKSFQRAKAARTYQAAGDTSKARQIWSDLANDPKAEAMVSEARIRLGELSAQPAKR